MISRPTLVACCALVALILTLTALGLPAGHSDSVFFNYGWSAQYTAALSWTDPLPRFLPGSWAGLGGYDFFFYAPLPFWFIAAVVSPLCPGCSTETEFVLGSAFILAASGLTMFAFLRSLVTTGAAAFGAVVYAVLPYHLLIDWFERQAVGEFTAYAFLPLIALGIERRRSGQGGGPVLALGVAGTALSHLPTALLAGHAFAVVVLVFVLRHPGGWGARLGLLARLAWFGLLGLALAAFYWLPAVTLLDTVSPAILFAPYFEPHNWLYGTLAAQPNPDFALRVALAFLVCLPVLLMTMLPARGPVRAWFLVPALFAIAMNTTATDAIWREWIISKVQFPWRLMTVVDFSTGVAAALLASGFAHPSTRRSLALAMLAAAVPASILVNTTSFIRSETPQDRFLDWFAGAEYFSPEMTEVIGVRLGKARLDHSDQGAIVGAVRALAEELAARAVIPDPAASRNRELQVLPPPGAAVLSLPVQYWFLWRAETDLGTGLEVRASPQSGTLEVVAPPEGFGKGPVRVWLPLHWTEWTGWGISLLAVLALLAFVRPWRRFETRHH